MATRRSAKPELEVRAPTFEELSEHLDNATGRELARLHVDRIWSDGDVGEQELLMMFLHLLHARKRSLNPDDVDARRADFDEQMKLVFEGA